MEEKIKQEKIRKVFLEELPRRNGENKQINWKECVGYKVRFIYDNIDGLIEIVNYYIKGKDSRLKLKYNDKEFDMMCGDFSYCRIGKILNVFTPNFKVEIGTRFKDNKRDIVIINKKKVGRYKYYQYRCNKCGFDSSKYYSIKDKEYKKEFWIEESNLLKGVGCSCCCSSPSIIVKGINDITTTDTWMIPIINDITFCKTHTHSSNDNINPYCPFCRHKKSKKMKINNIYTYHSISCPRCSDGLSYPNKFAFKMLEELNIDFIPEYSPEWIRPKRYDFYFKINNKEYMLEMDGGLGHGKGNYKNNITTDRSKSIDDYKDEQAKLHNIEVIRIDCELSNLDYIKTNILTSYLSDLFDLSKIDWLKVEDFALSNRVKEACDYWNNGINNTQKIAKIMKLARKTVIDYLKKGKNHSWCNYNPKKEIINTVTLNGLKRGKPVEIFKDGVSKGIFSSAREIVRQSEKLFGVELKFQGISEVCLGKKKSYKGYIFKFVD